MLEGNDFSDEWLHDEKPEKLSSKKNASMNNNEKCHLFVVQPLQ